MNRSKAHLLLVTFINIALVLTALLTNSAMAASSLQSAELALRPGDKIMLSLPGEPSLNYEVTIGRNGDIMLPEIGPTIIKNLTPNEASAHIKTLLQDFIRDVSRFEVILKKRQLMINVLGYVKQPGLVTLNDGSSIQEAIAAAKGLSPGAQLDKVQVRRNQEIFTFNYKQYLDSGDTSELPALQPLDTIFVPASPLIGNVQIEFDARTLTASGDGSDTNKSVTVFGEVIKPGTFAFKPDTSIVDLLMRAGGVTRYAGVEKIRVISKGQPIMFNLKQYLDSGDQQQLIQIAAGDTIFVPMAVDDVKTGLTVVYVMGEVFKPGAYEAAKNVSFLDILANAGGPTRFAETRQVRIIRANGQVTPFNLQQYTEGNAGNKIPSVNPGDAIFVPEKVDLNEKSWLKVPPERAVKVIGEVNKPGRFEWSDEMTLFDLIAHAGGPNHKGNIAGIKILSRDENGQMTSTVFNMAQFIEQGGELNSIPVIKAKDVVVVPELPRDPSDNKAQWVRQSSKDSIYIMGEVTTPGRYMFNDQLHFLDILAAAEGPNDKADIHNIRITHRNGPRAKVSHLNLGLYFETGDESLLPIVQTGDVIYIPAKNDLWLDRQKQQTVRVLGAINQQGRYRFDNDMTILDLLAKAGGFTNSALLDNIVVVNNSCCEHGVSTFDLLSFSKSGNPAMLPALRSGDTVYVMSESQSDWRRLLGGVQDTLGVLSVFRILAGG